jgi:predicted MPP superfamily phosphohydrolase
MTEKPKVGLLHYMFVAGDLVARLPAPALFLISTAVVGSAAWMWFNVTRRLMPGCVAGASLAFFVTTDWVMLAWLPRTGRSFGPVSPTLIALAAVRWALFAATALIPSTPEMPYWTAALAIIGNLALSGNALDSLWAEPFRLDVTRVEIKSPKLTGRPPVRVLHVSDLHVERITTRERRLLELVEELRPDLIVFTGDLLNLSFLDDARAQQDCHEVLSRLHAPLGVYAISGSPSVDRPSVVSKILDGLDIRHLDNRVEPLTLSPGDEPLMALVGVTCTNDAKRDGKTLGQVAAGVPNNPSTPFTLLLYHSPDLMPEAARAGIDLFLAGHTHGGQVRLPLVGALVTSSKYWKRYEMGLYVEGSTQLYVSRGIGMEGLGAPRARFLCPPEIELFELRGSESDE